MCLPIQASTYRMRQQLRIIVFTTMTRNWGFVVLCPSFTAIDDLQWMAAISKICDNVGKAFTLQREYEIEGGEELGLGRE